MLSFFGRAVDFSHDWEADPLARSRPPKNLGLSNPTVKSKILGPDFVDSEGGGQAPPKSSGCGATTGSPPASMQPKKFVPSEASEEKKKKITGAPTKFYESCLLKPRIASRRNSLAAFQRGASDQFRSEKHTFYLETRWHSHPGVAALLVAAVASEAAIAVDAVVVAVEVAASAVVTVVDVEVSQLPAQSRACSLGSESEHPAASQRAYLLWCPARNAHKSFSNRWPWRSSRRTRRSRKGRTRWWPWWQARCCWWKEGHSCEYILFLRAELRLSSARYSVAIRLDLTIFQITKS